MAEPASSAVGSFAAAKAIALGAAGLAALIMAAARPPESRRSIFLHAVVALGVSFLWGDQLALALMTITPWLDDATAMQRLDFNIAVHGMLGALSWGFVGMLASLRDKMRDDPASLVKAARDFLPGGK